MSTDGRHSQIVWINSSSLHPIERSPRAVRGFGGEAVMTSSAHERATDRVAEAAETTGGDVVIVIQGDEPLIHPEMIDAALEPVVEDDFRFSART